MAFELDPTRVVRFDHDKITARDFDDFEEATNGLDLLTFAESLQGMDPADALRQREQRVPFMAFLWIALRRSYPGLTFDEVYDEVGITEASTVIELVTNERPARAVAAPNSTPARGARRTQPVRAT